MNVVQSFFRYVAGRYRGRLSTARDSAMTMFVLTAAVGEECTKAKFWVGVLRGLFLYVIRVVKAIFDSTFEAVGFLLSRVLLPRHLVVRIIVGLAALNLVCFSMRVKSGWFIALCVVLFAINLLTALGTGTMGIRVCSLLR